MQQIGDVKQQEAIAESLANTRIGGKNSANKILYLVRVEDPTVKAKCRTYIGLKLREDPSMLDVVGYETNLQTQNKLTSYSGALEHAKKSNNVKIFHKRIPWARILDIEHKSYNK